MNAVRHKRLQTYCMIFKNSTRQAKLIYDNRNEISGCFWGKMKQCEGTFWGDGDILYLDRSIVFMGGYIFKTDQIYT